MGTEGKVFFAICMHILGVTATTCMFAFLCIKMFDMNTPLQYNVAALFISLISLTWLGIGGSYMMSNK